MTDEPSSQDVDVLVVGAGAAGLSAAIEAASKGARVHVVDQSPSWGGTASISGGGCFMVDTPLQRKLGIKDSVGQALDDWYRWSKGTSDMEWARFYIQRSCMELYHWFEELGVEWVGLKHQEGNSVPRWHRPKGGGLRIATCLHDEAVERGVERWSFSTEVLKLLRGERGRGIGAETLRDGKKERIYAKAVIVATGGFCSNYEMVYKNSPHLRHVNFLLGGGPYALGSGHRAVGDIGGLLVHLDHIWFYPYGTPDPHDQERRRGMVLRGMENSIWVNIRGRRFHNELLSGGATGTPALLSQESAMAWAIIDSSMVEEIEVAHPSYRTGSERDMEKIVELLSSSPFIKFASTVEELAKAIGVEAMELRDTLDTYNGYFDEGLSVDPAFGKPLRWLRKIEQKPLYAIQFRPLARKNFGGVKTDLACRVIDQYGSIIQGLYAAGEVAGMAGGHINGIAGLEGTMLGPSIFSGRVAGTAAAYHLGLTDLYLTPTIKSA